MSCAEGSMATEIDIFHSRHKPCSKSSTDPEPFSGFVCFLPGAKFPTYQSRIQSAESMNGQELLLQAGAKVGSAQHRTLS